MPSSTRSSAKRAPVDAANGTPPSKRIKISSSRSSHLSSSASKQVRASHGLESHINGAVGPRRLPTKIDTPKPGDRHGPRLSTPTTRTNCTLRVSTRSKDVDEDSDDADELGLRPSSATRAIELGNSTHTRIKPVGGFSKGKISSRTRNNIKDLVSGATSSKARSLDDGDDLPPVPVVVRAEPATATRSKRTILSEHHEPVRSSRDIISSQKQTSEEALDSREGSNDAKSRPSAAGLTLLPSPAPSTSTSKPVPSSPATIRSAASRRRTQRELATSGDVPSDINESDKATNRAWDSQSTTELTVTTANKTSPIFMPTPASTPERPNVPRTHSVKAVITLLDTVLRNLASPVASISGGRAPEPSNSQYRTWLSKQSCLSSNHEIAERDVRSTFDRTIRDGEGNCLLLIGERGIGKTAIVERSLSTLQTVYGKDSMLVVRLSGLIQRDDKSALKELARQLCSSVCIDDEENGENAVSFTSAANILSSLLAILEPGTTEDSRDTANKAKPLIIVIDEFDLFAHHSVRQSFLYCLLDCVQGGFRRGGMAVLGVSARADCIETLEKRVKSRCQSRVHHIMPAEDIFANTVDTARRAMLQNEAAGTHPDLIPEWNACVNHFFQDKSVKMGLVSMNDLRGLDADRRLFDILLSMTANLRFAICKTDKPVSTEALTLSPNQFAPYLQAVERSIPYGLSTVEVAMLIAAKHVVEEERPLNFVIAYERYSAHSKGIAASGLSQSRPFSRAVCLKAFEHLIKVKLLRDASTNSKAVSGAAAVYRPLKLSPWPFMIDEAVKSRKNIPQHLAKWCKSWSE